LLLISLGCDKTKLKTPSNDIPASNEDFNAFFRKFSSDTLFQKARIDNPLPIIISNSGGDSLQKMVVKKVSFEDKDWEGEIELSKAKVADDTFKVILQIVDTGVFMEHYFALRGHNWYLVEIKNLSD
jgi:hypothetical protein